LDRWRAETTRLRVKAFSPIISPSLVYQILIGENLMFASFIEMKLKPGKMAEAVSMTETMQADFQAMGMKQIIIVDKGNDKAMLLAFYETAQAQESVAPKAAELIGRLGVLLESPPERMQVKVPINFIF